MTDQKQQQNFPVAQGFTTVELMIAMLIGLILIGGILEVFISNSKTSILQIGLSKIQQDGRYAISAIAGEIRMADYKGCYHDLSIGIENNLNNPASFAWDLTNSVIGFDNIDNNFSLSDTASGGVISNMIAATDVLVIKGMADGVPISSNPDNDSFLLNSSLNRLKIGEIVIVSDCENASMFQVSNITTSGTVTTIQHSGSMLPGNSINSVSNRYAAGAEIARLTSTAYYLKNDASGRPGLYQSSLTANASGSTASLQENLLVSNVENMQIQYGLDKNADRNADEYQTAALVTDWKAVISIRISLLLASENSALVEQNASYSFDENTHSFTKDTSPAAGANKKLRRSFTGMTALRNRTL